jgi:hypothetical protein
VISNQWFTNIWTSYPTSAPPPILTNGLLVTTTNFPQSNYFRLETNLPTSDLAGCFLAPFQMVTNYTYYQITSYASVTNVSSTNSSHEDYDFGFQTGNYVVSTLKGRMRIDGNVRIYVQNDVFMNGFDSVEITTTSTLTLYMAGSSFHSTGRILNLNSNAMSFVYYGLPENTDVSLDGHLMGAIYAPNAAVSLRGGSSDVAQFMGSITAKSISSVNHLQVHYDENLARLPFPWNP